jgi:uncharacterized Zn-finger protein
MNQEDQNDSHECDVCGKIFQSKLLMIEHVKSHAQYEPASSLRRKRPFTANIKLEDDSDIEIEQSVEEANKSRIRLKRLHMIRDRISAMNQSGSNKRSQVYDQTRKYRCETCQKYFKTKQDLTRHNSIVHTNIRKFECKQCGKKFKRKTHLQDHMLLHSEERNHKCSNCPAAFKRNRDRLKHEKQYCKMR